MLVINDMAEFVVPDRQADNPYRAIMPHIEDVAIPYRRTVAAKKCSRCGKVLPASEFYSTNKNLNGLSSWCRKCTTEKVKESRKMRCAND